MEGKYYFQFNNVDEHGKPSIFLHRSLPEDIVEVVAGEHGGALVKQKLSNGDIVEWRLRESKDQIEHMLQSIRHANAQLLEEGEAGHG